MQFVDIHHADILQDDSTGEPTIDERIDDELFISRTKPFSSSTQYTPVHTTLSRLNKSDMFEAKFPQIPIRYGDV